jgi:4-diphosphocytidyl-2-C-methyl-D-erythritol kinase
VTQPVLRLAAPAKINLILEIQGRRSDGYHELKTVMHALDLADTLSFTRLKQPGIRVTCDHPQVPEGSGNLVYRATELLAQAAGQEPHVHIHITKKIPLAAGMGGGSSDAAAALLGLARLWDWHHPDKILAVAKELGSDVPFFLKGGCGLGTGRGERVVAWPEAAGLLVAVVNPGFAVSTAEVYKKINLRLTTEKACFNMMRQAIVEKNAEKISKYLLNHLESVTVPLHPELAGIKRDLLSCGALAAMMSGSGPTVFGFVPSVAVGQKIKKTLSARYPTVLLTRLQAATASGGTKRRRGV